MRSIGELRRLVNSICKSHCIEDPRVVQALLAVPRHLFVDEALRARAYSDDALPIGHGQTISKPSTVARMSEALTLSPGDRVLEVGTGSGYQAAVLAVLAGRVFSVERIAALAIRARRVLNQLRLFNVEIRPGDGAEGWAAAGPFEGIIVTAASATVPVDLLRQLRVGGRMVLPVHSGDGQTLRRFVRISEERWEEKVLEACQFVPLISPRVSQVAGG